MATLAETLAALDAQNTDQDTPTTLAESERAEDVTFDRSPQTLGGVFAESVRAGTAQLTSDFERFKGVANIVTGDEKAAQDNLAIAESYDEYSGELLNRIQPFEEFLEEPTFGGFFTQVTKAIGQFTPMAISSVASGFGGAAAGILGKGIVRKTTKSTVDDLYTAAKTKVARGETLDAAERTIIDEGFGYLKWAKRGGITGAFGQEYVVGTSQAAAEFQEAGMELTPIEARQALLLGVPQALLGTASETIFARAMLKNALKQSPLAALDRKAKTYGVANLSKNEKKLYNLTQKKVEDLTDAEKILINNYVGPEKNKYAQFIKDLAIGFGGSGAVEGITELGQEGLGVAQRFAIDDSYTQKEAKLRLAEAAFAGFFAGGARGGAGSAATSIIREARQLTDRGQAAAARDLADKQTYGDTPTQPKTPEDVKAEFGAGKQAVFIPGINSLDGTDFQKIAAEAGFSSSVPYKGGLIVGSEAALKEIVNIKGADTLGGGSTINQGNLERAVNKLFGGEDFINVVEGATHELKARNKKGQIIATKEIVANSPEERQAAEKAFAEKYSDTTVTAEPIDLVATTNTIDTDPDLDDYEAQQDLVQDAPEEGAEAGGTFGQQLDAAAQTVPPELVGRFEQRGDKNISVAIEDDPITYKKTTYTPKPNEKEGTAKAQDEELIQLRQDFLFGEFELDQEINQAQLDFWGPDINSPRMQTLSRSLLREYKKQKVNKPGLAIVTNPEDSSQYVFADINTQGVELQATQAVETAVIESFQNKFNQSQETPGFRVKVTAPNAPAKLGYGQKRIDFANSEVGVNMQTLIQAGLKLFPQMKLELNQAIEANGGNYDLALASMVEPVLQEFKKQGYTVQVQKDFGVTTSEFVDFDSKDAGLNLLQIPILRRKNAFGSNTPTSFISLEQLIDRSVRRLRTKDTNTRVEIRRYLDILKKVRQDPNVKDPQTIARVEFAIAGGDTNIFTRPIQGVTGRLNRIAEIDDNLANPNFPNSEKAALRTEKNTLEQELDRDDYDPAEQETTEPESGPQRPDVEGPTGPVPAMQTNIEQVDPNTGEVSRVTLPARPEEAPGDRKLAPTSERRDAFTETLQRRQDTPSTKQIEKAAAEGNQEVNAAEARLASMKETGTEGFVNQESAKLAPGVQASKAATSLFDLGTPQEVEGKSSQELASLSGANFIKSLARKIKTDFGINKKLFIITAQDNMDFALDTGQTTIKDAEGTKYNLNDYIKKAQQKVINKSGIKGMHVGLGRDTKGMSAAVIILDPESFGMDENLSGQEAQLQLAYVLGHELGHTVFKSELQRLAAEPKQRMLKKLLTEFRKQQQIMKDGPEEKQVGQYSPKYGEDYAFEEWYADQMSMYLLDQKGPPGSVTNEADTYFRALAAKIKKFFKFFVQSFKNRYGEGVNPVFADYANGTVAAFREGLTREEIPITTLEDVEINRWADESSKLVANFVGKKNATRFNALVKKILRSDEIKDARKFLTYILAPADNYLRQVNPELARTLYSQSQSLEASGYFNVHALVQNQYTNDFYKIFNIKKNPTEADLSRVDAALLEAEGLAAGNITAQEASAEAKAVLDFYNKFYDNYLTVNDNPDNPSVAKNLKFFTRQFDIAKLENEPAARNALVNILAEANPKTDRNIIENAVEQMIYKHENSDGTVQETTGDYAIGMQKDRAELFKALTDNTKLRNIEGVGDLIIPPHHAIRKYISDNVKKTEFRKLVKTVVTSKDAALDSSLAVGTTIRGPKAAEVMLKRIDKPKDQARAKKVVLAMLGKAGMDMPGWARTAQSYLLMLNVMTYLSFAAIASLPDLAGPMLRSKEMGIFNKTLRNELGSYFTNRAEMEAFARDVGVIGFDSISQMYINAGELGYMTEGTKFYTQQFFKYTGLEWYTNFTRIYAAGMGKQFLLKHANDGSAKSQEFLAELGVTAEQVKAAQAADFNFETVEDGAKVKAAIGRFVEESIVRPNAAERPGWASNPYTALIFQLKSFFYAYGKNIMGGVIRNTKSTFRRDGKISTAAMPAVFAATAMLPLAMVGMELRELMKYLFSPITGAIDMNDRTSAFSFDSNKFRTNRMEYGEWLLESADRSGGFGAFTMLFPMMEAGRFGDEIYTSLLGPSAQRLEDILKGDARFQDFLPGFGSF